MSRLIPGLGLIIVLAIAGGFAEQQALRKQSKPITLQPITFAQWQQKLAGYKGQIVVVDFWATWCGPCVERFPHMVQLYQKYGRDSEIRFVSMSLDDRSDRLALQNAQEFLVEQNAIFDNFRMDEIVPDAFQKLGILGIPAVFIYDSSGKLRYRLTGDNPNKQFTNKDVESAIKELLAGSK
jgi:thiol-disulfide isomerase/thioredoxin